MEIYKNLSNESSDNINILISNKITDYLLYLTEASTFIYTFTSIFCLIFVCCQIDRLRKRKKSALKTRNQDKYEMEHTIFILNEEIVRYSIFLIFILFELWFSVAMNIYGVFDENIGQSPRSETIGRNCTLLPDTFLSSLYDSREKSIILTINMYFEDLSYSMMVWMFGVSLLHLSYAAGNEIKVKIIRQLILSGLVFRAIIVAFKVIPYTGLFGEILQNLADLFIFFVVLYIAKRKFLPAMHSRVIDAFHTTGIRAYTYQKSLLNRYQLLVTFLMVTYGVIPFKGLILNSTTVLIESVSKNSCWFHATYDLPLFVLSKQTVEELTLINRCVDIMIQAIDFMAFSNLALVNIVFIITISVKYLNKKRKRYCHHYRVDIDTPLIGKEYFS